MKQIKFNVKAILIFLFIIVVGIGCWMTRKQPKKEKDYPTITGQICSVEDNQFQIRCFDENETEYTFSKTKEKNIYNGNVVTIAYKGTLNKEQEVQEIEVKKVTVKKTMISNLESNKITKELSDKLQSMTWKEKIGQMFLLRVPKTNQMQIVEQYQPGGYLLFKRDFQYQSSKEVQDKIKEYQSLSNTPMLIATTEEGGSVVHASLYLRDKPFSSIKSLYQRSGMDAIVADTQDKINFLKELGINVNIATVCDVVTDSNAFLFPRSLGTDANKTARYVQTSMSIYNDNHFGSVMKHFPGYGNSKTETEHNNQGYETFANNDFIPFEAGIKNHANCILLSNQVVEWIDQTLPASLSNKTVQTLREELNYHGVIMTDDLAMNQDYGSDEEIVIKAMQAGNDMVFCSNIEVQINAVYQALENGTLSKNQIDQSVLRILAWKQFLNLS